MNFIKGRKIKINNYVYIEFVVCFFMKIIMNVKIKFNKKVLINKILIIILDWWSVIVKIFIIGYFFYDCLFLFSFYFSDF